MTTTVNADREEVHVEQQQQAAPAVAVVPDPVLETVEPIAPREFVAVVDLRGAVLCIDCDGIYSTHDSATSKAEVTECPRCHSAVRFTLTRLIAPASTVHRVG